MDRVFLAVIVSALLLAAAAVCLFVVTTGGERTLSVMNLPAAPSTFVERAKPRNDGADQRR